jgi:hypothetical protein
MFDTPPTPRPNRPDAVGTILVSLTVYPEGEPGHEITLLDGTVLQNPGYRLADLRARFGGDDGVLIDPIRGEEHQVTLAPWSQADPDLTRVLVAYRLAGPGSPPAPTPPAAPQP